MKRSRLKKTGSKKKMNRMKKIVPITDVEWEQIDTMYNHEFPKYLNIKSRDKIVIRASVWEGAPYKKIEITPKDVIEYYDTQARNITSGVRTLAGFSTDWRMVDNMAKESLAIFKIINKDALVREGKKHGMELK